MNGVNCIAFPALSASGDPRTCFGSPIEFVAGPENRLAAVAVDAAMRFEAAEQYHPIVFCGPAGCGKSHLARGIAAEVARRQPDWPQVVVTAAEFAQEYGHSQYARDLGPFRQRFRTSKLLVVEDLAELEGRPGAQQELCATLDALRDAAGLAVITSRLSPQEMLTLPAALRSRLSAGLEVKLSLPGPEARLLIVQRLADSRNLDLPLAACRILADGLKAGVNELMGAVSALAAAGRTTGQPIDVTAARQLVANRQTRSAVGLQGIAAVTAKHFHLQVADLKSPSRARSVVQARGVAMWLARDLTSNSLGKIGSYFGGRDHTTVLHGCRRTHELIQSDVATREAVGQLRAQLVRT